MAMNERPDCKWYRAGKCIHFERRKYCHPSDFEWFNLAKPLHAVWVDRVCEFENPSFPAMFKITEEDIEALRNGKVLTITHPAPFFIAFMEGEENAEHREPGSVR